MSVSRVFKLFSAGFVLTALATVPAFAQQGLFLQSPTTQTPPAQLYTANAKQPDVGSIPALQNLVKNGAKLYYMGERSEMPGWLIVKDGQIQMVYLSPDHRTVLIGGMFTTQGENVTSPQIQGLMQSNADIKQLFTSSAEQQRDIVQNGGAVGGAASVPSGEASNTAAGKTAAAVPAGVSLSPGERLIQDMQAAAGVLVGHNDQAELMMMVAPNCPNCKSTWKELREPVLQGKLQVRLVPVYNSLGDKEKNVAAQLLKADKPFEVWDSYVSGDTKVLDGTPDPMAVRAVETNLNLVSKWNIQGYPYLVYRGRDGRVKIVQGRPERMAAVLLDLMR